MLELISRLTRSSKVTAEYARLSESQWLSAAEITALQDEKKALLLRHAVTRVPFYRERADHYHIWDECPPLTREQLRDGFAMLCADEAELRGLQPRTTGGTTGHPLLFHLDRRMATISRAIERRGDYEWTGSSPGARRAVVWGRSWQPRPAVAAALERYYKVRIKNNWKVNIGNMPEGQLLRYLHQLAEASPEIILGFPSAVGRIAELLAASPRVGLRPRTVILTGETLEPELRQKIATAFNARTFNRYAAGECGLIASECERGRMHVHAEHVLVEVLREGRPVPAGEAGELAVTHLSNALFPMVRYLIGDIGMLSAEDCPCGRKLPVIAEILGRTSESALTRNGRRVLAMTLNRSVREAGSDRVRQFQYFQEQPGKLMLKIVRGEGYDAATEDEIRRNLLSRRFPDGDMELEFKYVDSIARAPSGKYVSFVSSISASPVGEGGGVSGA